MKKKSKAKKPVKRRPKKQLDDYPEIEKEEKRPLSSSFDPLDVAEPLDVVEDLEEDADDDSEDKDY